MACIQERGPPGEIAGCRQRQAERAAGSSQPHSVRGGGGSTPRCVRPAVPSFIWAMVFAYLFASTDAACSTIIMDAKKEGTYTEKESFTFTDGCGILTSGCESIGKKGFAGSGLGDMTVSYDAANTLDIDEEAFSEACIGGGECGSSSIIVRMTCNGGCTASSQACTTSSACSDDKDGGTNCVACPCTTRRVDSRSEDWLSTKSGRGISFVTDCEELASPSPPNPPPPPPPDPPPPPPDPPPPPPDPPPSSPSPPPQCGEGTVLDGGTCVIDCYSGSSRRLSECLNERTAPPASSDATDASLQGLISAYLAEQPSLDGKSLQSDGGTLSGHLEKILKMAREQQDLQHFQQPAPA